MKFIFFLFRIMSKDDHCSVELLFRSIATQEGVFYKALSRDEPDLDEEEKIKILRNLFEHNPSIFLQRYHQFVSPCTAYSSVIFKRRF